MPIITLAQLAIVAPKADPKLAAAAVDHADDVLVRYGLATPARLADFMAHVLVESAYLTTAAEDLNYSATRLMAVWPDRFPTLGSCAGFAHVPEALACKVYGGRMGNNRARDGWTYRGQGLLQITGKDTYQRLATKLGKTLEETVLFITSAEGMLECAAAVYVMLGAPEHADRGDIVATTRCINGGLNGLDDRKAMRAKCSKVWAKVETPTPGPRAPLPERAPHDVAAAPHSATVRPCSRSLCPLRKA